jgi:NADH-quinone oxidoreductase subunit G
MSDNQVNIEIDGLQIQAENGALLIEAADQAGIHIPRFCYHKKLSVAANCRMCLVEVEKAPKPLPACATPVAEGMKVRTRSPKAIAAQQGTMEFLLINHPLDCPICDQGGECELQDVAMGYGNDVSQYSEHKRVVKDKDIGPLIATDMTRCIHCTRCVRFGEEIAGLREMGATGRGEFMEIGTYISHTISSELSGNVIDLCPVGALTAKPSRYVARAWEMVQHPGIATHDCLGSNTFIHTRNSELVRVAPRDNESINECWLSDRDRFSYEGLESGDRVTTPMMKQRGQWQEVDWETALNATAEAMLAAVPDQMAGLCASGATMEEQYLFQKLLRALDCHNIDHRLSQLDFSDQDDAPLFPWLGDDLQNIRESEYVFMLGADLRKEQPMLGHILRQAVLHDGRASALNPRDFDYNFDAFQAVVPTGQMVEQLAALVASVCGKKAYEIPQHLRGLTGGATPTEDIERVAKQISNRDSGHLLLGTWAINSPWLSQFRALMSLLAEASGLKFGYLSEGGNAAGAWLAGLVPHRGPAGERIEKPGLSAGELSDQAMATYLLFNTEPELDHAQGVKLTKLLKTAEQVIAVTTFAGEKMREYADILLPLAGFTETSGTLVNGEGRWQGFNGAARPVGDSRPGWKILRVLGNLTGKQGFEYDSSEMVREELKSRFSADLEFSNAAKSTAELRRPEVNSSVIQGAAYVPLYACDALVRRAQALQQMDDARGYAIVGPELAERLSLQTGDQVMMRQLDVAFSLPIKIDGSIKDNQVFVPRGVQATRDVPDFYGAFELSKVS